jgi:hypothetical protein
VFCERLGAGGEEHGAEHEEDDRDEELEHAPILPEQPPGP